MIYVPCSDENTLGEDDSIIYTFAKSKSGILLFLVENCWNVFGPTSKGVSFLT